MSNQIIVTEKAVYGNQAFYPACQRAELLAQIAGTKTLTRQALEIAKRMGFEIVVKQQETTI